MIYIILLLVCFIIGFIIGEWYQLDILDEQYFEKRWYDCE